MRFLSGRLTSLIELKPASPIHPISLFIRISHHEDQRLTNWHFDFLPSHPMEDGLRKDGEVVLDALVVMEQKKQNSF